MAEFDTVMAVAKKHGIEEGIDLSASKIDVRDWVVVKTRHQPEFKNANALPLEQMRTLVQHDYTKAVILLGAEETIIDKLIAIEQELTKEFPKAFVLAAGPQTKRPSLESSGVDALGTLRKFKKNVDVVPPMGILLLD